MGLKRKFEVDQEDVAPSYSRPIKQSKFSSSFSFTTVRTQDVAMSDASSSPTNASTSPPGSASSYPTFDLYPFPSYGSGDVEMDIGMDASPSSAADSRTSSNASETTPSVGLLQPTASFVHNFSNCAQIPRLRVACEAGIGGSRSLWTQCDECGAIEMINT